MSSAGSTTTTAFERLQDVLKGMTELGASDLHISDGSGRVVACEIMRLTKSTQDCILDPARTDTMKDFIEDGRDIYGMQTFDQHLTELYRSGVITLETAKSAATSPSDFERNLRFI